MPESFYLGDKGIVAISFRINRDGSFSADSLSIDRTSGKEPLDTAAASAIRATSPFEPLPPQFKGPNLDLRIGFYYNIRPDGATAVAGARFSIRTGGSETRSYSAPTYFRVGPLIAKPSFPSHRLAIRVVILSAAKDLSSPRCASHVVFICSALQ